QPIDALAGQQLPALLELGLVAGRVRAHLGLELAELLDQREHPGALFGEALAAGIDGESKYRHDACCSSLASPTPAPRLRSHRGPWAPWRGGSPGTARCASSCPSASAGWPAARRRRS